MADGGLFDFFSGAGGQGGLSDYIPLDSSPAAAPAEAPADSSELFDFGASGPGSGADRLQTGTVGGDQGFDWTKFLPAAIAGGSGLVGYLRGQGGATDKALKELHGATGPMQAAGNEQLQAYRTNTLTPTQQASIDQYRKQAEAKWQQYFASAGIPLSSAQADIQNKVNLDTKAYADKLLQQDFQNAFAATGMTTSNLTNIARQQALQDQEQRQQWAEFMKELGKLGGDVFGEGGILS